MHILSYVRDNHCGIFNRLLVAACTQAMAAASPIPTLLAGRLAVDFANAPGYPGAWPGQLAWDEFVGFLEASRIVSAERGASLLSLPRTDAQAADALLSRAVRLREALRNAFQAMVKHERVARDWIEPINGILRVTEGHDELVSDGTGWKLEFIAREGGLDWLLAAIARSAAEIITEGSRARLRLCANPACGLFFCDTSRTRRRRWCSMAICGNRHKVASFARRHA
jgi:predicted RNA-binding Zn ribbon-like protein